jgi:hypothetical protein
MHPRLCTGYATIIKREYSGEAGDFKYYFPFDRELLIVLKGALFGVLTMLTGNLIFSKKKRQIEAA